MNSQASFLLFSLAIAFYTYGSLRKKGRKSVNIQQTSEHLDQEAKYCAGKIILPWFMFD